MPPQNQSLLCFNLDHGSSVFRSDFRANLFILSSLSTKREAGAFTELSAGDEMKISLQHDNPEIINHVHGETGGCLYDLLRTNSSSDWTESICSPRKRLQNLLSEAGNCICADCGSPDPKWVSASIGVFICIKCSGVHRSLGVHISKVLSVTLDNWTHEQVDALSQIGGNIAVNLKYEAYVPSTYKKLKPYSSTEERTDFIRRKYELQQFLTSDSQTCYSFSISSHGKKPPLKQPSITCIHSIGHAFGSGKRRTEHKAAKKCGSTAGLVEFVGLIKVNIVRGTNLAVRDMITSDPYVILSLGNQLMKTRVIRNNLNPVWNECLMLSIPNNLPPLKLIVYDKDTFKRDDFMGSAEIDIEPLFLAAKDTESTSAYKVAKDNDIISLEDGSVKQKITIKLQKVERGLLEIELECVPLTQ